MGAAGRIQRVKTHVVQFTDHTGREALIVFDGRVPCPLPPLFSFTIYFTHPDVTPDTVRPVEVLETIKRKTPLENWCSIRLELYFLSASDVDSTDDECIAHYRKEKTAREDYTRQIQDFENSVTDHDEEQRQGGANVYGNNEGRQLPGLVPSYIDEPDVDCHHGLLFSYPSAEWRRDKRLVRCVYFDPISEEDYARITEGNGESEALPPAYVSSTPMHASDTTEEGQRFVGMAMFEISNARTKNEANNPWQEVIE